MTISNRLLKLWRAILGSSDVKLEARHQERVARARDELRRQLVNVNRGLARRAAVCKRTRAQLFRLDRERDTLKARLLLQLSAADRAGYAVQLEEVERETRDLRLQLAEMEGSYDQLLQARELTLRAARDNFKPLPRGRKQHALHTSMTARLGRLLERVTARSQLANRRARAGISATAKFDAERSRLAERALSRLEADGGNSRSVEVAS